MGTSVDSAYIDRLQEDITIACQRLEEQGHDSLVITLSNVGHFVSGSEKGRRYLEERQHLLVDFIQYCADTVPVALESDLTDEVHEQKNQSEHPGASEFSRDEAAEHSDTSNTHRNINETTLDMFNEDTDDYDDTDVVDIASQDDLSSETGVKNTEIKQEENTIKEEYIEQIVSLRKGGRQKVKAEVNGSNVHEAKVGLTRLKASRKSNRTRAGRRSGKWKQLVADKQKNSFPCALCGFEFKFETHLREHNQSNPHCKSEKVETTTEKYDNILQTELTFKDASSGEMKTKTVRELLDKQKSPYTCEVCQKSCNTPSKLKRHVFQHSEVKPFVCNICYVGFSIEETLLKHVGLHDLKPHYCMKCRSRFETPEKLQNHVEVCVNRDLTCVICGYEALTRNDLNDHRRTSHRGLMLHKKASQSDSDNLPEIHVCDICGKKLRNKLNVLRHKQSFHNEENPFRCKICDNRFKTQISLRRHEKTHDKPRYKCEFCDYGCSLMARYKNHMISHTKEKQYVCDLCGKQFRDKARLDSHRRIHTGETPYKCDFEGCNKAFRSAPLLRQHKCCHATSHAFICDFCGKCFKVKSQLRHHRKDHVIEFRWPCQYCEDKFKSVDRYKTHIARAHPEKTKEVESGSNIKFYPCNACPKVLINIEDFREHNNIHTGARPHKCRFCGKSFSSRKNMRQHEKSHTGEQKLRCRHCPKKYSDPSVLKVHLRNRHGIESDDDEMSSYIKDQAGKEDKSAVESDLKKPEEEECTEAPELMNSQNYPSSPHTYGQRIFPVIEDMKPLILPQNL